LAQEGRKKFRCQGQLQPCLLSSWALGATTTIVCSRSKGQLASLDHNLIQVWATTIINIVNIIIAAWLHNRATTTIDIINIIIAAGLLLNRATPAINIINIIIAAQSGKQRTLALLHIWTTTTTTSMIIHDYQLWLWLLLCQSLYGIIIISNSWIELVFKNRLTSATDQVTDVRKNALNKIEVKTKGIIVG